MKKKVKKVAKKKTKDIEQVMSERQNSHTEAMLSLEVCKAIVEELKIENYDIVDEPPKLYVDRYLVHLRNGHIIISFDSSNGSIFFKIPFDDNYMDRVKTIFEAMKFEGVVHADEDY